MMLQTLHIGSCAPGHVLFTVPGGCVASTLQTRLRVCGVWRGNDLLPRHERDT